MISFAKLWLKELHPRPFGLQGTIDAAINELVQATFILNSGLALAKYKPKC
jgi:hypothetical protein